MKNSTQWRKRSGNGIFPAGPDAFHLPRRNFSNNHFPGTSSQMPYSKKGATPSASKSTRPAVRWYRSHARAENHLGTVITPTVAYFSGYGDARSWRSCWPRRSWYTSSDRGYALLPSIVLQRSARYVSMALHNEATP